MGAASATLISDDALLGSDALTTAKLLACGHRRARNPTSSSPAPRAPTATRAPSRPQIAGVLDLPAITAAKSIEIEGGEVKVQRQTDAGYDDVDLPPSPAWSA